jgi:hypothetical protein
VGLADARFPTLPVAGGTPDTRVLRGAILGYSLGATIREMWISSSAEAVNFHIRIFAADFRAQQ